MDGPLFIAMSNEGVAADHVKTTPIILSSSPLDVEDMMEDSPIPNPSAEYHCDVEIMSPTPAYDDDTNHFDDEYSEYYDANDSSMDDIDAMMMDSPAPVSRKTSFEMPKISVVE